METATASALREHAGQPAFDPRKYIELLQRRAAGGAACPDCGGPLVRGEGCTLCPVCGFSNCG